MDRSMKVSSKMVNDVDTDAAMVRDACMKASFMIPWTLGITSFHYKNRHCLECNHLRVKFILQARKNPHYTTTIMYSETLTKLRIEGLKVCLDKRKMILS